MRQNRGPQRDRPGQSSRGLVAPESNVQGNLATRAKCAARALANALLDLKHLTEDTAKGKGFSSKAEWAEARMAQLVRLTLDLSGTSNSIGDEGAVALGKARRVGVTEVAVYNRAGGACSNLVILFVSGERDGCLQ